MPTDPALAVQLARFEETLSEQVAAALAAARACPPGGNFIWDRFLEGYGVPPQSADERLRSVAEGKQNSGASPVELRRVLEVIAHRARTALEGMAAQASPQDLKIGGLRYRLSTLCESEERGYLASFTVRATVSSVFANAKATAAKQPWKQVEYKTGFTYVCVHCGAPQQAQLNFICRYCDKPIAEKVP